MNVDAANALLARLRRDNDVSRLSLGGVCMWPVFRLAVLYKVIRGTPVVGGMRQLSSTISSNLEVTPNHLPRDMVPTKLSDALGFDLPTPGADLLLFQSWRDFTAKGADGPVDPLVDGLNSLAVKSSCISLIGHPSLRSGQAGLGYIQPVANMPNFGDRDVTRFLTIIRALTAQANRHANSWLVQPMDCLAWAIHIVSNIAAFRCVLEHLQPRAIMLQGYMNLEKIALCAAARELCIPLIDHQHGMFTEGAEIYLSWLDVPDGVVDPVPSVFWVWSDWFLERMPQTTGSSRAITGGDLRRDNAEEGRSMPVRGAHTVLYLHQALGGANHDGRVIPAQMVNAIQNAPRDWFWLVRLHPRFLNQIDAVAQELSAFDNVSIEDASYTSLAACIAVSDVAVTGSSSAAFQTVDAGLTTVFTDTQMRLRLPDCDDEKLIHFADGSDLIDILASGRRYEARPTFLLRDPALSRTAMADILNQT